MAPVALLAALWPCGLAVQADFAAIDPRPGMEIRFARRSSEVSSSPFATLTSFEVHGADEDAGVIQAMAALGVKHVVMHNIHGSLSDAHDPRLNAWLDGCAREGIDVRCILASPDPELWRVALTNYGDRIHHWCYLNEPNAPGADNDHSRPVVRPEQYVEGLRQIRAVLKEVRPDAWLWGPEEAMLQHMEESPWPWLRLAIEAGLLTQIDGFSFHPYRQGYSPENTPEKPSTFEGRPTGRYATYEGQIGTLREMTRHKPLAVHEVGWSTTPNGPISELTQAKFALRQQIQDFALGIDCCVWFMLRERHVDAPFAAGHLENHFGIVRTDNSPKPAYRALQSLYAQLDDGCTRAYPPVTFDREGLKWYVFDDFTETPPARKVLYWLPIAARDDCPVERVRVRVGDVDVLAAPVSDAPRLLRLHRVDGAWGWPVVLDLVAQEADRAVEWERTDEEH